MTKTVRLVIDGIEVEVPAGRKVIEAAASAGILIPRFCYHPALGSVGACRVCAVKFVEGPVKGIEMSCMQEARDGMVVSTTDEEAVDFRRHVIEWLMMNHPLDCPVCDEGGHCLLQDLTVAGGHGIRRFPGKKRTYRDQHLGVFVQHEMNRCIQCFRCRRFYQEFAGYRDFGVLQIADRTYFGRFSDGPLESPFAGNLVDICPTGVLTDKPSRYKGRRWDFERCPSLCIHCSLGCLTVASARYREMVRMEARFSNAVNGYFICDRGRYGFYYANLPERPGRIRIDQEEVDRARGIRSAGEKITALLQRHGPDSLACLGSMRSSLEDQAMLKILCRHMAWKAPQYFEDLATQEKVQSAVARLDERIAVSLREIEKADFILAIGADPVQEAPMLALAMRQAVRNGGSVVVLDPRPVFLPFPFTHVPVAPRDAADCLSALVKKAVDSSRVSGLGERAVQFLDRLPADYPFPDSRAEDLSRMADALRRSQRPVLVCGTDVVLPTTPDRVADHALLLQAQKGRAGLFYLLPGPNAFGAALFAAPGALEEILQGIERGTIRGMVIVENDPFDRFPDRRRLEEALDKLELLVVLDYLPSPAAQRAHILIPTSTLFERRASFVNQEGRLQRAEPAHRGGTPVEQTGRGGHPPRVYGTGIPGADPQPAWKVLAELAAAMGKKLLVQGTVEEVWGLMGREHPLLNPEQLQGIPVEGVRLLQERKEKDFSSAPGQPAEGPHDENELELFFVDWTFETEELSGYSAVIREVEKAPLLLMSARDGSRLGLGDKDPVILHLDGGPLEVALGLSERMAPGVLFLPRHRRLSWQKVKKTPVRILPDQIRKK
jgi:NADH-quinone oxidoreductase subunit G